jgi:pilus assembly protein Flp/PilA
LQPNWRRENRKGVDGSFSMQRLLLAFLKNESGATAIEYCLIALGISIVIIAAVNGIGSGLNEKFVSVNTSIK